MRQINCSVRGKEIFQYIFYWYVAAAAAAAKLLQLCWILCDPIDGSSSGSAVPGILQARTLEWVAISFSNAWKWKVKVKSLTRARLLATPWTTAYQAPPSMGFSRQEYWSGMPLPSLPLPHTFCFNSSLKYLGFPGGSVVKNPPATQDMWVQSLGQEDHLEKEMSTHSSILAWEIP